MGLGWGYGALRTRPGDREDLREEDEGYLGMGDSEPLGGVQERLAGGEIESLPPLAYCRGN